MRTIAITSNQTNRATGDHTNISKSLDLQFYTQATKTTSPLIILLWPLSERLFIKNERRVKYLFARKDYSYRSPEIANRTKAENLFSLQFTDVSMHKSQEMHVLMAPPVILDLGSSNQAGGSEEESRKRWQVQSAMIFWHLQTVMTRTRIPWHKHRARVYRDCGALNLRAPQQRQSRAWGEGNAGRRGSGENSQPHG